MKTSICSLLAVATCLSAAPIRLTNPSGEINPGVSPALISDPGVIGWESDGGQVIRNGTDYGNGAWRMSFEDSRHIRQMTSHVIQTGASYSLRFDAAMFATGSPTGNVTLIGGTLRNGNFNADTSTTASRPFSDTPDWYNLGGAQSAEATKTDNAVDGSRNAVLSQDGSRLFASDTGHTLVTGQTLRATYQWRDASGWDDASDKVGVTLFTTSDDTITGTRTVIETKLSAVSSVDASYQGETADFSAIPASAAGKRLFVYFTGVDGNAVTASSFARLDNFTLEVVSGTGNVDPATRVIIADLYVDDNGSPLPVATRSFLFKSTTVGSWNHYHLAVPAGTLNAHSGKALGIRFRAVDLGPGNFQSVDNVRLDYWPAGSPDGSFSDNWNSTPNQPWAGPGYWANRLQDWQVSANRVQCVNGARERLTLHRPGTSIRGNGGNFSLSVRTGLNTGTSTAGSRAGFLLGGAPNVDWRGALLVHDALGRDFGLFIGIAGDGKLYIEDYSTGATTALASTTTAGFGPNTRLDLGATYNSGPGTYTLTLTAFNSSNAQIGAINTTVPSDRVLGAFGLLSHYGTSAATHWFDNFSGTGGALHPESDRHLAILGAMHTLSKGNLKLTAQLSPLDLTSNPSVALETWNGSSWSQIATAPVDTTDGLSSYTATFAIPGWNDTVDTDYRLRINISGTDFSWNGTIRRDPVDKQEIVIAMTTCQRINDGNMQTNGFDWSPVMLWQPHVQSYEHIAKHQPDVLLAHGDQIYEGQPTSPDKSSATNRQLDYLYKWNLWVLQVRDLTRDIPTVAIPDDHDVFQGNLWGEGGVSTTTAENGGYTEPASWVRMVERTQTSNLPDPDPYNPVQPAPPANATTGIGVYFTGMTYGRLGFAILEDRKFKTGTTSPPPADQQHLLGERQHEFLREWNKDWAGQDLKLVVSQSPLTNLRTHAGTGYAYFLNDKDTHGWPAHRRNEAWRLLRVSRMFQLAGDQHLATLVHHGADSPRDAGISFTAPAMANFFPRSFDPVHNTTGTTATVSPYKGDYYFNGVGTLPDGVTPNRTAADPQHFAVLGAANSREYYEQTTGIDPANYHDRGAGYGITRVDKTTRRISFECWPIHSDPEFPQTGTQFPDWPATISQTDNDGRVATGFLTTIDTHWRKNSVIRVYDESDNSLVYAMRVRGNLFRPPVYDNSKTYRIEVAHEDGPVSETYSGLAPVIAGSPAIHSFTSIRPSIVNGAASTLRWDVSGPAMLTIDQGIGNVMVHTVDGIGFLEVSPSTDTTYTLTLNGSVTASATVRVFPGRAAWNALHFTPAELAAPAISGGDKDPDGDGFTTDMEYLFQTNPRSSTSRPILRGEVVNDGGTLRVDFSSPCPLDAAGCTLFVESSTDLETWTRLPSNSFSETSRDNFPATGTSRITIRLNAPVPTAAPRQLFRAGWDLD